MSACDVLLLGQTVYKNTDASAEFPPTDGWVKGARGEDPAPTLRFL